MNRRYSLCTSGTVPKTTFITKFGPAGISKTSAEPKHKVLLEEAIKVREIIQKSGVDESATDLSLIQPKEWEQELIKSEEAKLEKYMRSRWATVLLTLKEVMKNPDKGLTKRKLEKKFMDALKAKIKEKIIFEITNPSLAKITRSKTPPADAPRKIREEYRKAHPEEEDNFPDIVLQLTKVKGNAKEVEEKKALPKMPRKAASFMVKADKKGPCKFPYRSTLDNPKMKKIKKLELLTHDSDKLKWKAENNISADTKLFAISGSYQDVRTALTSRGWMENTELNSDFFDFKWTLKCREINHERLREYQIVNHFQRNSELSTKVGLLHNIKNLVWFNGTDVDTFYPNSYDLADVEVPDFIEEFKVTKAEAILKSHIAKAKPLKETGITKVTLAICISERRLKRLHELLAEPLVNSTIVSNEEWDMLSCHKMMEAKMFKEKYPLLKKRIEALYTHYRNQYPSALTDDEAITSKVKDVLAKLQARYPQYTLNGTRNIWIVKPAGLSRGRGIHMFSDLKKLQDFIKGKHYVVQKYIENPLIILNRKFDIRQWVLVTSWNPLKVWVYGEMYVRFGAEDYNMDMIGNKFMHLTNNSITKGCAKEYKIKGNMWTQDEFLAYLKDMFKGNVWEEKIKPKMYEIIVKSLQSTEDVVIHRDKSFEMFGYDIMVDEYLNPWLIEVNCSPALDYSTEVTERLVKMGMEDTIKVAVDYETAPVEKKPEISTGKYVKIYEGTKKPPQFNLSLSFANKKMQNIKCC